MTSPEFVEVCCFWLDVFRHPQYIEATAEPVKVTNHKKIVGKNDSLTEIAIIELKNGNYLFVRFIGKESDPKFGINETIEYETYTDAYKIYAEMQ